VLGVGPDPSTPPYLLLKENAALIKKSAAKTSRMA